MTSVPLGATAPTGAELLLLRAALMTPDLAAAAWYEWRATTSVEDSHPRVHGLLPLVAANLPDDVLGSDSAKLQGLRRRAWAVTERLRTRQPGLIDQLTEVEPRVRPIRGSAFLADPGRVGRPVAQLDLQVRPDRWEPAVRALLATRWHIAAARSRSHAGIALADTDGITVVLDWAPSFPASLRRPLDGAGAADTWMRLLLAVVEGLRPPGNATLMWPVDVTLLARRMTETDWDELVCAAASARLAPIIGTGLRWANQELHVAAPVAILDALEAGPLDRVLAKRFRGYATGDQQPDRWRRRTDIRRAARQHGIDIHLWAPDHSVVTRAWALLRPASSPGARVRS